MPTISKQFDSRKQALAALKSRCSTMHYTGTSGEWALATLRIVGDTLHIDSNYHSAETLELLMEKGRKAATKTLPNA